MIESLIRELYRFQDLLANLIPTELWEPWAESNENIIKWLEDYYKKEK